MYRVRVRVMFLKRGWRLCGVVLCVGLCCVCVSSCLKIFSGRVRVIFVKRGWRLCGVEGLGFGCRVRVSGVGLGCRVRVSG